MGGVRLGLPDDGTINVQDLTELSFLNGNFDLDYCCVD